MAKWVQCPDCGGDGIDTMDDTMYCPLCDGYGRIPCEAAERVQRGWAKYGKAAP